MSDENSNNTGDSENPKNASAASSEIDALLEDLRAKKLAFEEFIASSSTAIEKAVGDIDASVSVIDGLKNDVATQKGVIDSTQAAIVQTATNAKANLTQIEELKTGVATVKGAIEATQKAASADLGIITQSKAEIETLKSAAVMLSEKLAEEHDDIAERITALQGQHASLQNILKDLAEMKSSAENDDATAKAFVKEISDSKDGFVNLSKDTQAQYDGLVQRQNTLQGKIVEIEDANSKINNLRHKLLESSDDAKSVQDEIDDLRSRIDTILKEVSDHRDAAVNALTALTQKTQQDSQNLITALNDKFNKLHENLQEKILALLPSAGAAGLSSTYYDAKSRYAPTSFATKLGASSATGWWAWIRRKLGYNPASVVATGFFYALFISPLGIIIYYSLQLLSRMENDKSFVLDNKMLAVRFLIALPLATLSGFGFASLRLYRKLYEEYNHKQRVMELYQSFSNEIAANGDEGHKKALLTIMLNSVASKAWENAEKPDADVKGLSTLSSLERVTDDVAKLKSIFNGS